MLVLGLILILLSAGALIAVLASGTDEQAALYGSNVELPTLVIFLAGAATLLLFIMGLELLRSGMRRANKNRKNNKKLRKLEKREQLRHETKADGSTGPVDGPRRHHPAGGSTAATARPLPAARRPTTTAAPGAGPDTRTDGPFQTPPPASR